MTIKDFAELLIHGPRHARLPGEIHETWLSLAERQAHEARQRMARLGLTAVAVGTLALWYMAYQIIFRPWVGP